MKSKKGFTLVELMIVVVIMAILVVVAVPIYNSVTDNAREKTCLDNQRQIIGTVGNLFAIENIAGVGGPVSVIFTAGDNPTITEASSGALSTFSSGRVTLDTINSSFQTVPVCGDEANTITAVITANPEGTATVSTSCTNTEHVLNLTNS
ncbi:MAG: type II secretion system protein [Clostridia bacterium]|nr:type II secretion system protein [Clostridia bacterium]